MKIGHLLLYMMNGLFLRIVDSMVDSRNRAFALWECWGFSDTLLDEVHNLTNEVDPRRLRIKGQSFRVIHVWCLLRSQNQKWCEAKKRKYPPSRLPLWKRQLLSPCVYLEWDRIRQPASSPFWICRSLESGAALCPLDFHQTSSSFGPALNMPQTRRESLLLACSELAQSQRQILVDMNESQGRLSSASRCSLANWNPYRRLLVDW